MTFVRSSYGTGLAALVGLALSLGACGDRSAVDASGGRSPTGSTARSVSTSVVSSSTTSTVPSLGFPRQPNFIDASLDPRVVRAGGRIRITIENISDHPAFLTENSLPLFDLNGAKPKMIWAVPIESVGGPPASVEPDGAYEAGDVGSIFQSMKPGFRGSDDVIIPPLQPGEYEFVVAACATRGPDGSAYNCGVSCVFRFIHGCPQQAVEVRFSVVA